MAHHPWWCGPVRAADALGAQGNARAAPDGCTAEGGEPRAALRARARIAWRHGFRRQAADRGGLGVFELTVRGFVVGRRPSPWLTTLGGVARSAQRTPSGHKATLGLRPTAAPPRAVSHGRLFEPGPGSRDEPGFGGRPRTVGDRRCFGSRSADPSSAGGRARGSPPLVVWPGPRSGRFLGTRQRLSFAQRLRPRRGRATGGSSSPGPDRVTSWVRGSGLREPRCCRRRWRWRRRRGPARCSSAASPSSGGGPWAGPGSRRRCRRGG